MNYSVGNTRNEVLVITPPNSNTVIEGQLLTVTRPEEHSDWSDFLSLGCLSLVCSLRDNPRLKPIYIDGTIIKIDEILRYISSNKNKILAVCISALTANYEAGILIMRHAKEESGQIWTVIGNDHFTAIPIECLSARDCIDFGFIGNEVVRSFSRLINNLYLNLKIEPEEYPSLALRVSGKIKIAPSTQEPVFSGYNYDLIDSVFPHSEIYNAGFQRRIAPRIQKLIGKTLSAGAPVDIGRGCVKFAKNNACSFCSIQYAGMWKNSLSADGAWQAIGCAWHSGFDYLYITADELPLTFAPLLNEMKRKKPAWWLDLTAEQQPFVVGYARADAICDPYKTALLTELGIRQVMIGMDAGSPVSLAAMNKPLQPSNHAKFEHYAEVLYLQNFQAIRTARELGMLIRAGFVMGHIGMSYRLLRENVGMIKELISSGKDVISALDIEVLTPTPGSLDFNCLVQPALAQSIAGQLGLRIASPEELTTIAANWRKKDDISPELAMRDYVRAFMPDVEFSALAEARSEIREFAKEHGVVVGE